MSVDFRFIDFNYPFQSNVALTATSENTEFPATNAGNEIRGNTWRSTGSFIIDSTNNAIDFKESGAGPEANATIVSGTFSVSGLAAAVKVALEAVSPNGRTYTVSQSASSGKWTITGSVFLELLYLTGTNTATSVDSTLGFTKVDHTGATTYTGSKTALHTEEGLVIDIKTQEEVDTFAAVFDPFIGIKFSEGATLNLQANHANEWSSPPVDISLAIDNQYQIITHFFTSSQSFRFWRVKIVDPQNAYLYVELGTLILGKSTDLLRIPDNGFNLITRDQSKIIRNEFRNEYVDEFPQFRTLRFNMNVFEYATKQLIDTLYRRVGNRTPVFVALDTAEDLFDKDDIAIYGRMLASQDFKHVVKGVFGTKMEISETL